MIDTSHLVPEVFLRALKRASDSGMSHEFLLAFFSDPKWDADTMNEACFHALYEWDL